MSTIWKVLTRKKEIDTESVEETRLSRVLGTFDLTALGVGSTLGVGIYVLAGKVALTAGPSVILSFLIAAIASVFAGLCYAEFGARTPKTGSAYVYTYVCVGEFVAFVIGWNLILEYVIGSASVARGLCLYLDTLLNNTLENTFKEIAPINVSFMSEYFDFMAFGISIVLAIALAFGLKESSLVNNIFTSLNIGIVLFVIIAGSLKADFKNWNIQPSNTTNATNIGEGGFFPFGLEGTIAGAATCFYGFIGFDCIATTGEEVRNPRKAIPIAIIVSLGIVFLAYFGISTILTLMVPYYLQDARASIPYAFDQIGWGWAKWVVAVGGTCGLLASLFGAMFPLPRIIFAMASDGLVFKFLGKINPRFQTPVIGTILAGVLTGLMGALFDLAQLVNMMSIGTLMAYTVVAASVLLLRYTDEERRQYAPVRVNSDSDDNELSIFRYSDSDQLTPERTNTRYIAQFLNCGRHSQPTKKSQNIVAFNVFLYCVTCIFIGLSAIYLKNSISEGETWAIVLASTAIGIACILIMSVATQPVSRQELSFKVPMVPLIPALSILTNIYLMLNLDSETWIRFAVWMAVGLPTYYFSIKSQNPEVTETKVKPNEPLANGTSNGGEHYYDNVAFVEELTANAETVPKKKKKAPVAPPVLEDKIEDKIIGELDEMLDKVAKDLEFDRKSSVGSVSVSMSREENVVADVHCDNVLNPAVPSPPDPKLERPTTLALTTNVNDDVESAEVQKNAVELRRSSSVDSPAPPDTPVSFKSAPVSSDDDPTASPEQISPTPTPPPSANVSPLPTPKLVTFTIPPPPPIPMPEIVQESKNITKQEAQEEEKENKHNSTLPRITSNDPEMPEIIPESKDITEQEALKDKEQKENKHKSTLPRINSNDIKRITLKSIAKKRVQIEDQNKADEPDDDNLKLGSERAKSFKEKLSNKLAEVPMTPFYIMPRKKQAAPKPPQEHKKNENVLEESINKDQAREKLGLFVTSRLSWLDPSKEGSPVTSAPPSPNVEIDLPSTPSPETHDVDEPIVEAVDKDYMAHQNRMKNVFRSLKVGELTKEPNTSERNFKSLDHREHKVDDKDKHKQAMSEIFKTIQLRRKASAAQQSKV
uniref:High affinity cationic amino acid transporter 1-like isoform X1 n=1 Tax=Diabrotica virgifera virgifera TaxID=50390 RepID=A0A6P7GJA4_DIAVI